MSTLTAPSKDVFDPAKNYARVRFIGDRDAQDFEFNEAQQIQDQMRQDSLKPIFAQDVIVRESGGTVGVANQGVKVGNVVATSSGLYRGFTTQVYTLLVSAGGGPGTAKIKVTSNGSDNGPEGTGFEFSILSSDPLDGSVNYDVGVQGVKVAFTDNKVVKSFTVADSWTILATHGRRLPVVNGGASTITPFDIEVHTEGRILTVPSQTLTYPAASSGTSVVYVEVLREKITSSDDNELVAALTGLPAAERERIKATFKTTDASQDSLPANGLQRRVFPAYLWDRATNNVTRATERPFAFSLADIPGQIDGSALSGLNFSTELSGLLAELVLDVTGTSYRIKGLRARLSTNTPPVDKTLVTVEGGVARISGVRITKAIEEDLALDLALDTAEVLDEGKVFSSGTNVYALNKGVGADKFPVKQINQLTATVEVTQQITKGVPNGLDALPLTPVVSIVDIPGHTTPADYVQNGNFVDWSPGGSEPSQGASYNVTWRYTKQMVLSTDFQLIDSDSDGDLDSVDFSPAGDDPVNGTTFLVDYDYFLPRIDLVYLRTDGQFAVVKGTPGDNPSPPEVPTKFLGVAQVRLEANSSTNIQVTNFDNRLVPHSAIRDAIKRQENLTINDARQELLNNARLRETANLKNVFADAFSTEDQADTAHNRPAGQGGDSPGTTITYDALIDLFRLELSLPLTIETKLLTKNDGLIPSGQIGTTAARDFVTLPYSEVLEIDQDQWSEERNINPFLSFVAPAPDITLTPDRDLGIDETVSTDNDIFFAFRGGRRLRRATREGANLPNSHPRWRETGRSVEEVGRLIEERAGTFMRQIVVEVRGRRFVPGEDNVAAAFDGKAVNLIPINGTLAGSQAGTVKARTVTGDWEATFTIPPNVPTGTRTLVVTGDTSTAAAPYTGELIERDITILTREIISVRRPDPLAQTLAFLQATTITRVEVPFAQKDPDSPVEFQWRDVAFPGGVPGDLVFETLVRQASSVSIGSTSVNNFLFDNPQFMAAGDFRAIVLLTDSSLYHVYTGTLGQGGFNPVAFITSNLNVRGNEPPGIVLESLNTVNWEPRSKSALRYRVYRADFEPEAYVYFDSISSVNYSQLYLTVDQVIPEGTSVTWQVSIDGLPIGDGGKKWINIVPFSLLDLGTIATDIDVRAKLATTNARITPYVSPENWHLQGVLAKASGKYVSRRFTQTEDITNVKIFVEVNEPGVTSIDYFISNAEDVSGDPIWEPVTTVDQSTDLGDGFTGLQLSKTLNNGIGEKQNLREVRVRIDMSTSNQAIVPRIRNLAVTLNGA